MNKRGGHRWGLVPFKWSVGFCSLLLLASYVPAMGQSPGLKERHSIAMPGPGVRWEVSYRFPAEKGTTDREPVEGAPAALRELHPVLREENTMGVGVRKEVRYFRDGSPLTRYVTNGSVLYRDADTHKISVEPSDSQAFGGPISATFLPEFSWVDPMWYQGMRQIDGVLCDVYSRPWPLEVSAETSGFHSSRQIMTALIAQESRRPLMLETPVETRIYKFSASSAPVELPAEFSQALTEIEKAIEKRCNRYAIPQ